MRSTRFTMILAMVCCMAMLYSAKGIAMPQPVVRVDTSVMEVRVLEKDHLEAYPKQRDFNYEVQRPQGMSLWERIKAWFWMKFDELFSNRYVSEGTKILLWVITIFVLGYVLLRVIGLDKVRLFVTGGKPLPLEFTTGDEDILAMDLDKEILSAESAGEYRKAVRLQYLRSLKLLSERSRITWSPSKTNIDYISELHGGTLESEFRRITRIFEYAWYGEMEIGPDPYERAASWFRDFNNSVGS